MKKAYALLGSLLIAFSISLCAGELNAKNVAALERSKAQDPSVLQLRGDTPDQKVNYRVGEEMQFKIRLDGKDGENYQVKIQRDGDDQVVAEEIRDIKIGEEIIFKTAAKAPGFVIVRAILLQNGKPVKIKNKELMYTGGLGAELESVKANPAPDDFDAYWDAEIKKISATPAKGNLKEVPGNSPDSKLYTFTVPCGNGMETTGFVSIPAKPGKYPASISFYGYGPVSSVNSPKPGKNLANTIVMTVSRFGILPLQSKEYYDEQAKKFIKYGFTDNEDREKSFFKGMLVRDYQAVQFLKTLPEWDGKTISISGGSMGGYQVMCVAGMEPAITNVNCSFPWCCALETPKNAKIKDSFRPAFTKELRYFDPVQFARRISKNCKVHISTGIGDRVCPVNTVFRAYANIPGDGKSLTLIQGPTHAACHKNPQKYNIKGNDLNNSK